MNEGFFGVGVQSLGMGGHQSARMGKDEWLTPPEILRVLGPFDLDPCAPVVRPWPMAEHHFDICQDGLHRPWFGRVWLNPPYGDKTGHWLERLAQHRNGIALIFARTETDHFFRYVWERATSILFLRGRLNFHHVDGTRSEHNSGAPSCLVAYGGNNTTALINSRIPGQVVHL